METEQLISEVEKRPVLWDTSVESYKDRNKKNEAWLNVTSALYENFSNNTETEEKMIVQEVISKWRSVRDNYIRSLKKQAECSKSGSGVKKIQRYIFEQQLSFLKKCRKQRPTCSSIQIHEQTNEDTPGSDFDDIESNINNNTQCSENEGNQKDTSTKSTPAKKRKTILSLEDKLGAFLDSRTLNTNSSSVDMTDEDMAFYTSTLPIVKTLTLNQKMRFRIEVMQLLQNIKHTDSSMESSISPTSYNVPYGHHNMPLSSHTYSDQYLQSNMLSPNSASSSNSIQTYYYTVFSRRPKSTIKPLKK